MIEAIINLESKHYYPELQMIINDDINWFDD